MFSRRSLFAALGLALPVLVKGSGAISADDVFVRALRNCRELSG